MLTDAVREGRLEGLRALRDVIAKEIDDGPKGEKAVSQTAPLARQLRDVLDQIAVLEKSQPKASFVDDLSRRREARVAGTEGAAAAAGGGRE